MGQAPPSSAQTVSGLGTAFAGMLGLAVAMGFGRFAYTPLLPLMIQQHWISIQQGALLASFNLAGYLAGALIGIAAGARARVLIVSGLALTALSTLTMGLTHSLAAWYVLRAISGVASAWSLVGLTNWSIGRLREGGALSWRGFVFAGPGVGIVFSGLFVSALHALGIDAGHIWVGLGLLSGAAAILVLRETGISRSRLPRVLAPDAARTPRGFPATAGLLVAAYTLAGFGYITTATFLPLIAREALHAGAADAVLWPILGAFTAAGAIIIGFGHSRHNTCLLTLAYLLQSIGVVAPALSASSLALATSSILVGSTFMSIVMLTMHEARSRYVSASLVSILTSGYAFGQMMGPYITGLLFHHTKSFQATLFLSGGLLVLAAALTVAERALWVRDIS